MINDVVVNAAMTYMACCDCCPQLLVWISTCLLYLSTLPVSGSLLGWSILHKDWMMQGIGLIVCEASHPSMACSVCFYCLQTVLEALA